MAKKKKAQGRAGQKGKAQKAKGPRGADDFDDAWSDNAPSKSLGSFTPQKGFKGFAQKSPSGLTPLGSQVKLRHLNISFVSAGSNTPTAKPIPDVHASLGADQDGQPEADEDEVMILDSDTDADDNAIMTNLTTDMERGLRQNFKAHMHIQSEEELRHESEVEVEVEEEENDNMTVSVPDTFHSEPLFVLDTVGDPALAPASKGKGKQPVMRAPSPTPSSSSEEIVFHGRSRGQKIMDDPLESNSTAHAKKPAHVKLAPHITDDLLAALETPPIQDPPPNTTRSSFRLIKAEVSQPQVAWTPAPSYPHWRKKQELDSATPIAGPVDSMLWKATSKETPKQFVRQEERDKEAVETIASLQAAVKERTRTKRAEKQSKTEIADFVELDSSKSNRRGKRGRKRNNRDLRAAVANGDGDDDNDSAAEAAYDDYMANLAAQLDDDDADEQSRDALARLSRSELLAGPSLVVDGKEIGEDEVLPKHHTTDEWEDATSSESDEIDNISGDEEVIDISDMDSSELEDELDYTIKEQWEDEEDLRQRRFDQMTDEQIARLYTKQQDLGIDCEDLVIDDGIFASDAEDFGDLNAARTAFSQLAGSTVGRTSKTRSRRKRGEFSFPDASALADTIDQYGDAGFDIMDFDRPSLRPTKKGRKGKLPPELEALSDEEFRNNMYDAWDNDRAKKREQKALREQLRAEGMLGSSGKKGKADLSMKYLEGMTMTQVRDELRVFLQDDGQNSRPFPPMDKKDRKSLHEIASAFNLNSKSVGSGKNRFPVLNKTSRTIEYSDNVFNRVMAAHERGFLKVSGKGKGFGGSGKGNKFRTPRGGQGGGFSSAATGLRNGEVVGANAAEIGKESFGHKMMEKMGWSKGMALGKDGEGMLVPVAQVMRSGKAGLG